MNMEDFNPRVDESNLQTINLSSSEEESGACGTYIYKIPYKIVTFYMRHNLAIYAYVFVRI
jgi:hypothetical protein